MGSLQRTGAAGIAPVIQRCWARLRPLIGLYVMRQGKRLIRREWLIAVAIALVPFGDALQLLRHEPPDLIILDLTMPVMDGITFLQHLRADARLGSTPVIVLTAQPIHLPRQAHGSEQPQGLRSGIPEWRGVVRHENRTRRKRKLAWHCIIAGYASRSA